MAEGSGEIHCSVYLLPLWIWIPIAQNELSMLLIIHGSNVSWLDNSVGYEVHHCWILLLGDGSTSLDVVGEKKISGGSREVVTVKHQNSVLMAKPLHDSNPILDNGVHMGCLMKSLVVLLQ